MNINYNEISKKFPLAYGSLISFLSLKYCVNPDVTDTEGIEEDLKTNYFCYCDLEKFFDDNEIIITIDYDSTDRSKKKYYFRIYYDKSKYQNGKDFFILRPEAKEQAILKALAILENKLKG